MNTRTEELSKARTQPPYSLKTQGIENKKQNMHPTKLKQEISILTYNHPKLQVPSYQQNTISNSQGNSGKTQASGENKSFKEIREK